jgi:hypothetical protein
MKKPRWFGPCPPYGSVGSLAISCFVSLKLWLIAYVDVRITEKTWNYVRTAEQRWANTHGVSQSALAKGSSRVWRLYTPRRSTASAVCQSKGRSLLGQHNVPAVSGHIQSNWAQGRLQSFRVAGHILPRLANKGVGVRIACSSCRAFAYIHDTEVHRCEL